MFQVAEIAHGAVLILDIQLYCLGAGEVDRDWVSIVAACSPQREPPDGGTFLVSVPRP
jgi:hypothetical protein